MIQLPEKYKTLYEKAQKLTVPFGEPESVEYCPENRNVTFLTAAFPDTPAHIVLHLTLHSQAGSRIGVTLGLPLENWNGKFLGLGNGGAAGTTVTADVRRGVTMGYATAHTDMGTTPEPMDSVGNWIALEDFGHRATHLMTVAGKSLVEQFYGCAPACSLFHGGSTGGQQALSEAQRYLEDYDGILCCYPAFDRVRLHTQFAWSLSRMNADGRQHFTPEELTAVNKRLVEEYAEICGAAPGDRFLSYPDQIGAIDYEIFRDEKMTCPLSEEQISLLRQIYEGPTDPVTGEHIFEGYIPGAELQMLGLPEMNQPETYIRNLFFPFFWAYPEWDLKNVDFHGNYQQARRELSPILDAVSTDLSAFRARGGKLMLLHGTADAAIPYASSLRYYRTLIEENGGVENTIAFCRYFLVPGFGHGFGGSGFHHMGQLDFACVPIDRLHDPLLALDAWVTEAEPPEQLLAVAFAEGKILGPDIAMERPVYRYPYRTRYISGDPCKPDSFGRNNVSNT